MSDLRSFMLVADTDKEQALKISASTAEKIVSNETSLVEVVQSLGEYIVDEDAVIRGKAVSYLTAIVKALPDNYLTRQQISVLTEFFCERLNDGGAITGLDRLQSLNRFTSDSVKKVAQTLFKNVDEIQKRSQSQRFQVFTLLNNLMSRHRRALHSMGEQSLVGIVHLVSGERDPRNLMIIFSVLRVVMVEWDISEHVDLLFESVYNYFPITFKPPPNDPYKITAQDLKDRLRDCISSTSYFAPFAFPALIDKLDSHSANVKRDVLDALAACISSYDPAVVSRYSRAIWDALKFEILNLQEEILSDESKRILRLLAQKLPEEEGRKSLSQYLKPIIKECSEQLQEPLHKQAKPAQAIVRELSAASPSSFEIIARAVIPLLFETYVKADTIAKKRGILEVFVALLESALEVYGSWSQPTSQLPSGSSLSEYREKIVDTLSMALMGLKEEVSFRITALKGLLRLSSLHGFLQDEQIALFVKQLNEILLLESKERPALKAEAVAALAELSNFKSKLIVESTFPALISILPDEGDEEKRKDYTMTLESLAKISGERAVLETFVRRILSKFDVAIQHGNEGDSAYPRTLLAAIISAMEDYEGLELALNLESYFDRIVVKLCRRSALAAIGKDSAACLTDALTLDVLGRLCNLLVRHAPRNKQDEACKNLYSLFAQDEGFEAVLSQQDPSEASKQTMILSTYLLAGLPKDSKLPGADPDVTPLLKQLLSVSTESSNTPVQLTFSRHISLLANKFVPAPELSVVTDLLSTLMPSANSPFTPSQLRTVFWLAKALVLRLAPSTPQILNSLLNLLSSPDAVTSTTAARGFALLLSPDDLLSQTNGANIRLLAKQRIFTSIVPLISSSVRELNSVGTAAQGESSKTAPEHAKSAYLTALSSILAHVPSILLEPWIPTLLPLLLQTLDLDSLEFASIKSATLETLSMIIRDNGLGVISEAGYVDGLVKRLLSTSAFTKASGKASSNTPHVRAQALQCLFLIARAPDAKSPSKPSPLLPLKSTVLRGLKTALDDPKRNVRKAAVDARGAWLRGVDDISNDD